MGCSSQAAIVAAALFGVVVVEREPAVEGRAQLYLGKGDVGHVGSARSGEHGREDLHVGLERAGERAGGERLAALQAGAGEVVLAGETAAVAQQRERERKGEHAGEQRGVREAQGPRAQAQQQVRAAQEREQAEQAEQ